MDAMETERKMPGYGYGPQTTKKVAHDSMQKLCNALNGGSRKDAVDGITDWLRHEHRHLQSGAIFALLESLGNLALDNTDARNQAAIKACAKLRAALRDFIYWPDTAQKGGA